MCIELHIKVPAVGGMNADKPPRIICLTEICMLVPRVQFDQCACEIGPRTGVPFDEPIRKPSRIDFIRAGDRRSRCSQEAELVAAIDGAVLDLLWPDDHADCGAGSDDRVAALADSRAVSRQPGAIRHKEGSRRPVSGGPDPNPGGPEPLIAESIDPVSVQRDPVHPGTHQARPVFPGRAAGGAAAWYGERSFQAETTVPDAIETSVRPGG